MSIVFIEKIKKNLKKNRQLLLRRIGSKNRGLTKPEKVDTIVLRFSFILYIIMKGEKKEKQAWITQAAAGANRKGWACSRFLGFLILTGAQLLLYIGVVFALFYNSALGITLQVGIQTLSFITAVCIIGKGGVPSMKTAWLFLVAFFPAVGVAAYLFYGNGRAARSLRERLEKSKAEICAWRAKNPLYLPSIERADPTSAYLEKQAQSPAYTDGKIFYYADGATLYAAMLSAVQSAEKFVLVEYFIIQRGKMWDELLKILLEKAAVGVQIRILYDDFGSIKTLPAGYAQEVESLHENVRCMAFNRVTPALAFRLNYRDHRKMLVVDGKTAFTGGVNLADEYIGEKRRFGYWKDSGVQVQGRAACEFTQEFLCLWNALSAQAENIDFYLQTEETPPEKARKDFFVQPYADSPLDEKQIGLGAYAGLIQQAKKSVWIFTPYLVLDEYLRGALCHAAKRGVDVRIVTPGVPDKKTVFRLTRANYFPLLKAGVKIYEYTYGFLHAKSVLCDGERAIVGTVNFDYRSLYHHFENAVYFSERAAVAALELDYTQTFAQSKLCTEEDVKIGFFGRLWDGVLKIFETLL